MIELKLLNAYNLAPNFFTDSDFTRLEVISVALEDVSVFALGVFLVCLELLDIFITLDIFFTLKDIFEGVELFGGLGLSLFSSELSDMNLALGFLLVMEDTLEGLKVFDSFKFSFFGVIDIVLLFDLLLDLKNSLDFTDI